MPTTVLIGPILSCPVPDFLIFQTMIDMFSYNISLLSMIMSIRPCVHPSYSDSFLVQNSMVRLPWHF